MINPKKQSKQPGEDWIMAPDKEDRVRLMIIEKYSPKEISIYTGVTTEFVQSIGNKYELIIRNRFDGDRAYFEYSNKRDRSGW